MVAKSEGARVLGRTELSSLIAERRKTVESDFGLTSFRMALSALTSRVGVGDAGHIGGTERGGNVVFKRGTV